MNVILHCPADMTELKKKTAAVHAEAVAGYISRLNCPKEQKLRLIEAVQSEAALQVHNTKKWSGHS